MFIQAACVLAPGHINLSIQVASLRVAGDTSHLNAVEPLLVGAARPEVARRAGLLRPLEFNARCQMYTQ
jgi:hypothetical protein